MGSLGNKVLIGVDLRESGWEIFGGTEVMMKRETIGIIGLCISTELGEGVCKSGTLTLIP